MKLKKIFLIGLLVLGLGALSTTNHVQAATAKRVNVPQKFRGTWYAADQNKVKAYKITKSKITVMFSHLLKILRPTNILHMRTRLYLKTTVSIP